MPFIANLHVKTTQKAPDIIRPTGNIVQNGWATLRIKFVLSPAATVRSMLVRIIMTTDFFIKPLKGVEHTSGMTRRLFTRLAHTLNRQSIAHDITERAPGGIRT